MQTSSTKNRGDNPRRPIDKQALSEQIKRFALGQCGFSQIQITPARNLVKSSKLYKKWLDQNYNGQMDYLDKHYPLKTNPKKIVENAKSIIVVSLNYYQDRKPSKSEGQIARYAHGRDYHKVFQKKLRQLQEFIKQLSPTASIRHFADSGPLLERQYAKQAGLGYIGKNTMLITKPFGSWILLGDLITDIELEYDELTNELEINETHGVCGTCKRCIDVCPTGALKSEYEIDARLCISYLTIENKEGIPEDLRPKIGNWLFGCDLCQEVCPHNHRQKQTAVSDFNQRIAGNEQELKAILSLKNDSDFEKLFAGSPVMRAKRTGLIRNACVVAGNLKRIDLIPELLEISQNNDKMLAEHATWALNQIKNANQ